MFVSPMQVDVDNHSEWVEQEGVAFTKLPAFFTYKNGVVSERLECDNVTENKLEELILKLVRV